MSGCSGGSCPSGSCDPGERLPPGMLSCYSIDDTADGVLIWLEIDRDNNIPALSEASLEILSGFRKIYDGRIFGAVFGDAELKPLYSDVFAHGADTLYHIKNNKLTKFHSGAYSEAIADLCDRLRVSMVLMAATSKGRELAPRTAALLGTGLTADCTKISVENNRLIMTRPAFGGNLMAEVQCDTYPQMATVRPGTFRKGFREDGRKGTVIYRQYSGDSFKEILSLDTVRGDDTDISKSKILISLGNGVKSREAVDIAESVATKLNGTVSCSRALVDKGWLPQSRQVGQSGRTVSPEVYIAFGISGSIQHKAGMASAKKIISVNIDPDAPIHEISDISIIGDALSVLRELDRSL